MQAFHDRLREMRLKNNIMAKSMAELLGVSYRNYQRYEKGEIDITLTKLNVLAKFFDVSLDYMSGRSDNPKIVNPMSGV